MAKTSTEHLSNNLNIISTGTLIVGDINSEGDIRIDGTLKGTLNVSSKLVLGNTGKVIGEIYCRTADVSGSIEGKISVDDLLFLKETAQVNGEINVSKLSIEQGAEFSGICNMKGNIESKALDNVNNEERKEE